MQGNNQKDLWWGYLHESGTIQVKRFWDKRDLTEAYNSPFCKRVFIPFEANSREEAIQYIQEKLKK